MPTLLQKCEVHENRGPKDRKIKHKAATDYLFKPCLNLHPPGHHPWEQQFFEVPPPPQFTSVRLTLVFEFCE